MGPLGGVAILEGVLDISDRMGEFPLSRGGVVATRVAAAEAAAGLGGVAGEENMVVEVPHPRGGVPIARGGVPMPDRAVELRAGRAGDPRALRAGL